MKMPEFAKYKRVDDMVECFPIKKETEKELLEKMPNAYGGETPGEDDWPEPDSSRDAPYKLSTVWSKLSSAAQEDLIAAYEKETK
jgi:hypothetical protein